MMRNRTSRLTIILLYLGLLGTFTLSAAELTIITETDEALCFQVQLTTPLQWRLERDPARGADYLTIDNAYLKPVSIAPQALLVPYFQWLVALPTTLKPTLTYRIIETAIYRLPAALRDEELKYLNSLPTLDIPEVGWMGQNPAAVFYLHPLQAGPEANTITVIKAIEITVTFPTKGAPRKSLNQMDTRTAAAFLNARAAPHWRQAITPALKKSITYPAGQWYRLTISEDGIYQVTLSDLRSAGLTLTQIDTNRLKIYTNSTGGRVLTDDFPEQADPALVEVAREIRGDDNAYLEANDTLIFYARGSSGQALTSAGKLTFERNYFSNHNYYWLLVAEEPQSAKPMATTPNTTQQPDYYSTTTEVLERHEVDAVNFLHSGRFWYGEKLNGSGSTATVIFNLNSTQDKIATEVKIRTKGATENASYTFRLYINDLINPHTSWTSYDYAGAIKSITANLTKGTNIFRLALTANPSAGVAYLDYIECLYSNGLTISQSAYRFWGPRQDGVIEYQLDGAVQTNYALYDVSDWQNVTKQQFSQSGTTITFRAANSATNRHQYILCTSNQRLKPSKIEQIAGADFTSLHNSHQTADYIIITDEQLVSAAGELAKLHSQEVPAADRLETVVVTQQQILREFHGDVTDPNAIRNFLRYAYLNWNRPPSFVLLFGDGNYDYRGIETAQGNLVMTYQVEPYGESTEGFVSYTSDARFTYIIGSDRIMDLAIGRINVHNLQEAQQVVAKIRKYVLQPEYGEWRSTVTLMADDPQRPNDNEQYHVMDSENYIVTSISKCMNLHKLYLLEFPEVQDASTYGVKKPAATTALLDQLAKGTTIVNYLGHGSPTIWAQEYVLVKDRDLGKINTGMKLPLWIGATCSWGRFDQTSEDCMPEALLLASFNGAIGAIAATRPTYPTPNAAFVSSILKKWFSGKQINRYRLGEVFQMSLIGTNENNEKYVLLGDPALRLALPYNSAAFEKLPTDTLVTLQNVTLKGQVTNTNTNFSGTGIVKVYDSDRSVTRQYLDFAGTLRSMSYILPGGILYNGQIQIESNAFQARFYVPKDINYANRVGKITLYGWNPATREEAGGYYDSLYYQGAVGTIDTIGPKIVIGFQGLDFRNGDAVTPDARLLIRLSDAHGINITGQLGHEITLQFDQRSDLTYAVTSAMAYDLDSDTSGTILVALPDLPAGPHTLTVKAWDNANNWATASAAFSLVPTTELKLQQVVNYPNPFTKSTDFTFYLTQPAEVKITIFSIRGVPIATLNSNQVLPAGFHFISWNGKDRYGDEISNGIYFYKIQANSSDQKQKTHFIGKMVKAKS